MKHKRLLTLMLVLALILTLAVPAAAAGSGYFPDVSAGDWYADGVNWAYEAGIIKGYPNGTFGVGRNCTWDESMIMLWRAAGEKIVDGSKTETERAWAWMERQCCVSTAFAKADFPITRLEFASLLYLALTDFPDIPCELSFKDIDFSSYGDSAAAYEMALRWCVSKGLMKGCGSDRFCPDDTLTREQVVTVLQRFFEDKPQYEVTEKTVPFYLDEGDAMDLVFLDGVTDVPYVKVGTVEQLMEKVCNILSISKYQKQEYDLTVTASGDRVLMTRENGFPMILDFDKDTISFMDYDAFLRTTSEGNIMDLIESNGFDVEGRPAYFQILSSSSERYGRTLTLDLGAYGLRMVRQGDNYYIPLQTVTDILLTPLGLPVTYNGEGVFITQPAGELAEVYYSAPTGERSTPLIYFTYKELCFMLDTLYGLSEQHGIDSFAEEIQMIEGMQAGLMSSDPAASDEALSRLVSFYLDDLHSGFGANSYLEGPVAEWQVQYGASTKNMINSMINAHIARMTAYPNGVPGYVEVDDTAFITFDSFTANVSTDYYITAPNETAADTVGLMLYSFAQITREGSPVKNVVLDLSNNGGGSTQAAAFVIGMFLGEGSISVQNMLTGALVTENFRCDMNLDRAFDEHDTLDGYNLYCMISPVSFSCGNLVPSVLKSSHKVTILGQTSGGGACAVMHASTADGAFFQFSSPYCLSFLKNGSFYDIDQGVTPDIFIRDFSTMYDREAMVEIIHNVR